MQMKYRQKQISERQHTSHRFSTPTDFLKMIIIIIINIYHKAVDGPFGLFKL